MDFFRSFFIGLLLVFLLSVNASASVGVDTKIHNNIVYLLQDSPAHLKRYDLVSEAFLADIDFETLDAATALHVDDDGIYVGFGTRFSRFDLDGSNGRSLSNTDWDVTEIVTSDTNIYALHRDNLVSIAKSDDSLNGTEEYFYRMKGLSFSQSSNRLFARDAGISPSDILYINLPTDGTLPPGFFGQNDSPYHGGYPGADKTFLFPDETRVIDDSGTIYSTSDLTYLASLGGPFLDIVFFGDLPIVLRAGALHSYSNTLLETGSVDLDAGHDVERIALFGENVFGFYLDTEGELSIVKIPLSSLTPDQPREPIDPVGLEYTPDQVVVGADGIVYILSKTHVSIFRWSLREQQYLPTLPLLNVAKYIAYSSQNNSVYVAYDNGTINQIPLDGTYTEAGFAILPQTALGLATAGEYIFAVDPSGLRVSHYTFQPTGELISNVDLNYQSDEYVWSDANRRMYHLRDGTSPNDLHYEEIGSDGTIGAMGESPYHSSTGFNHPIIVAPDGSVVVLGSGRIYNGLSLEQVDELSNGILDGVWNGSRLLTLKESAVETALQHWDTENDYTRTAEEIVPGLPLKLTQAILDGEHWLSIMTSVDGVPMFKPYDMGDDLDVDDDLIPNVEDNCVYTSNADQNDGDSDGIGDACEGDIDNDGVANDVDNCPTLPNDLQANLDGDALGDACDPDDDNDQVLDRFDNCPVAANMSQDDLDEDSIGDACDLDIDGDEFGNDADNCPLVSNPLQENLDGDAFGDACDPDIDNDDFENGVDCAPVDSSVWRLALGFLDPDEDGHGEGASVELCIGDSLPAQYFSAATDNCPGLPNPEQKNSDDDPQGDACDNDDDNDLIADVSDNCPVNKNADQSNIDGDSEGDICDADQDNDGVLNVVDVDPANPEMCQDSDADMCDDCSIGVDGFGPLADFQPENDGTDTNSDGVCNVGDDDDDGDGVLDVDDNCPLISNPDQLDKDESGVGDICELLDSDEFCIPLKLSDKFALICL